MGNSSSQEDSGRHHHGTQQTKIQPKLPQSPTSSKSASKTVPSSQGSGAKDINPEQQQQQQQHQQHQQQHSSTTGSQQQDFSHVENVAPSAPNTDNNIPERPAPLRRKSTLLLQGDIEQDMTPASGGTGASQGKNGSNQGNHQTPLSRAGSGDEIQLGDDVTAEPKYETLISWHQGGETVYVTGSFTGWRRMIKLNEQAEDGHKGVFSVLLKLPRGTHRMRFVVDNELRCSDYLPSATDSMGNLVNYIEVGIDDEEDEDDGMEPLHRTSSNYDEQRNAHDYQVEQRYVDEESQLHDTDMPDEDEGEGYERFHEEAPVEPEQKFTNEIPPVFTDPQVMDQFVASDYVTPPQLPPHLESVILNSTGNDEKDNNSVLPIPNHVVLNHLATASIKHNVLAVASISRYSRKYVTQILYAPL